jgi:hypothetical protein
VILLSPTSRATEKRHELAGGHSITSSASASSCGGISRPSAFAVLVRLRMVLGQARQQAIARLCLPLSNARLLALVGLGVILDNAAAGVLIKVLRAPARWPEKVLPEEDHVGAHEREPEKKSRVAGREHSRASALSSDSTRGYEDTMSNRGHAGSLAEADSLHAGSFQARAPPTFSRRGQRAFERLPQPASWAVPATAAPSRADPRTAG